MLRASLNNMNVYVLCSIRRLQQLGKELQRVGQGN